MGKQKRLRDEVDKTLGIMDQMEPLDAGPYFYTRLQAKLHSLEKEKKKWLPHFLESAGLIYVKKLRPVMLALLIGINVISAVFFLVESKSTRSGEKDQAILSAFVKDYSLNRNTYDTNVTEKMTAVKEENK